MQLMTAVAAAAVVMIAAGMAFSVMIMVAAPGIGVIVQTAAQECCHSSIRAARNTAVNHDSLLCQCHPGTAADAAADQRLHIQCPQNACQRAMAAAARGNHLSRHHFAFGDLIDLEGLRVAKVLEHHTVFVSNRNSHKKDFLSIFLLVYHARLRMS